MSSRAEFLRNILKEGDLITANQCGGSFGEVFFTGWNGRWIKGDLTPASAVFSSSGTADDIPPVNVTHVNRVSIAGLENEGEWPVKWLTKRRDLVPAIKRLELSGDLETLLSAAADFMTQTETGGMPDVPRLRREFGAALFEYQGEAEGEIPERYPFAECPKCGSLRRDNPECDQCNLPF